MPYPYQEWLLYNPVAHAIDAARLGFSSGYQSVSGLDLPYLYTCGIVLIFVGLHTDLTGRQNAKFVCRMLGHDREMKEKIDFIEDFAEIGEAFDEPVKTYSSGMRSRLKFAISLAFEFDVYISDEVTSAGDAAFHKKASNAFKTMAAKSGLIMVSHSESTLREFCQSGIWLNDGLANWFDNLEDALKAYKESSST